MRSSLLGQSIGQVFCARVAHGGGDAERRAIVEHTSGILFDLSMTVFSWLFVLAPALFRIAFGREWEGSGDIARTLMPWLAASFVASPLSQFALVCGRQDTDVSGWLIWRRVRSVIGRNRIVPSNCQ